MKSYRVIIALISFWMFLSCATAHELQPGETEGLMGDDMPMPKFLGDEAKYSFPAFLWRNTQYLRFRLKKDEKQMHKSAVFFMLENAQNGEIVSWHSDKRDAVGRVRVIHSFGTGAGLCRTYQAYIKLNGKEKHMTNNACKKIWSPTWVFYK